MFFSILRRIHLIAIIYSLSLQVAAQTNQPDSGTPSWITSTSTTNSQLNSSSSDSSSYLSGNLSLSVGSSTLSNSATSISNSIASPTQGSAVTYQTGATGTTVSSTSSITNAASSQQSGDVSPVNLSSAEGSISGSGSGSTTTISNSSTSPLQVSAITTSTVSGLSSLLFTYSGTEFASITNTPGTIQGQTSGVPTSSSAVAVLPSITPPASTLTTSPPGFSTEAATNTLWSGNTWITTTAGGTTTVVPVLVGCHSCGGIHGGIILWNFPDIPNVSFNIPGFPSLPNFHFPCIQIIGIKINCPPPATDGDADKLNPSEGPETIPTTQTDNASRTSSSITSSSSTTSSSTTFSTSSFSSSSACSTTETVSDCSIVCGATATGLASAGAPATSQGCSTTCYSTLTGCSITGTTTITTQSSSTRQPCAYTCSACGAATIPEVAATATAMTVTSSAALKARVLPVPLQYSGGLLQLLQVAYTDPQTTWVSHRGSITRQGLSSALKYKFRNQPFTIGVKNLRGCTSVAVLSKRGIWLSHFWEVEGFSNGEEQFEREVIDAMTWGDGPEMPSFADAAREMFGPDPQNNYEITNWIYIFTVLSNAADAAPGEIAFPTQIDRIIRVVNQLITGGNDQSKDSPVYIVPYLSDDETELQGKQITSPIGKVLFQYSPAYSCGGPATQYAESRLYFQEDQMFHNLFEPPVELFNTGPVPWYWTPMDPIPPPRKRDLANSPQGACPIATTSGQETVILASTGVIYTASLPEPPNTFWASATPLPPINPTTGAVFCAPTAGPDSAPTGVPSTSIISNITDYCLFVVENTQGQIGCIESEGGCEGTLLTAYPLPYDYPGVTVWFNISLESGSFSSFSENSCDSALTSVLNVCADPFDQSSMVFGGGIPVSDGTGGIINFNISLESDTSMDVNSTSEQSASTEAPALSASTEASALSSLTEAPALSSSTEAPALSASTEAPALSSLTEASALSSSTRAPPAPPSPTPPSPSSPTTTPTPSPAPLYTPGTCNIHVWEAASSFNTPLYVQLNITDGAGHLLSSTHSQIAFGKSVTVATSDTNLPYPISVTFAQATKATKVKPKMVGGGGPSTVDWEKWILELSAGTTVWNSAITTGSPECTVGGWDNGNFLDWLDSLLLGPTNIPVESPDGLSLGLLSGTTGELAE